MYPFLETIRPTTHLALHLVVPALIAWRWGGDRRWQIFALLMLSMLIDLDHLIADPIYSPGRCSIGFHPLHQAPAAFVYGGLAVLRPTRWFGIGALLHLALDALDCVWMGW